MEGKILHCRKHLQKLLELLNLNFFLQPFLDLEVEDIAARLAELKRAGAQLIDEQPRRGAGGHLIAFIHPKSTSGVLIELVQKGPNEGATIE